VRALVADPDDSQDVIVAPATPPGVSAVAVLRLSGPAGRALAVARRLAPQLPERPPPREALLCRLVADGREVDEALVLFFPAPRSSTGEEVVELHPHGSPAIVEALLAAAREAGARPARPGEFTRRALAHGKLDLAQAEGIAALAAAEDRGVARRAFGLVQGELTRRVTAVREELLDALAELEATLDFPEDMGLRDAAGTAGRLFELKRILLELLAGSAGAPAERRPVVVLAGRPNAGKSTLFNALLGRDRVIVTPVPGTTRDAVAETVRIGERSVRLVDTAGLRSTDDQVERIGVDVARRAAAGADLLLYLVDGRAPASEEDVAALETLRPAVVVRTKSDLWGGGEEGLAVSAETGEGMDALRRLVAERLSGTECEGELPALERHRQALAAAAEALAEAAALSEEPLMAAALRRALHALGEITGETASEELLDRIFARFCIGK